MDYLPTDSINAIPIRRLSRSSVPPIISTFNIQHPSKFASNIKMLVHALHTFRHLPPPFATFRDLSVLLHITRMRYVLTNRAIITWIEFALVQGHAITCLPFQTADFFPPRTADPTTNPRLRNIAPGRDENVSIPYEIRCT